MSDYRIEKLRRELKLVLADGSRLEGEVFLRSVSRYRPRPEEPVDMLNDAEPFFAFERSGEAILVSKAQVSTAETTLQEDDALEIGALGISVEVTMRDGTEYLGSVFLESPNDRPRLLDFLNGYRDRFVPLVCPNVVILLNTQHVAHVREVA
ncbi:MAG: hypothetical protein AABZ80_01155 [Gemmatimonadota bacterium]